MQTICITHTITPRGPYSNAYHLYFFAFSKSLFESGICIYFASYNVFHSFPNPTTYYWDEMNHPSIHPSIPARIRKQLWRWYAIVWPDTISGCHYGWYCFCMMALQIFPPIAYNLASVPSYWSHKYLSSTQSLEMGAGGPIEIFVQQLCRMFAKLHCSGLRSRSETH